MIILITISLLSALFHNLAEIKTLKAQLDAAGKDFSWKEHTRRNWVAWLATLVWIVIVTLGHSYIGKYVPDTFSTTVISMLVYAVSGYGGSSWATDVFSSSQKRLTQVIDNTLNKPDGKI